MTQMTENNEERLCTKCNEMKAIEEFPLYGPKQHYKPKHHCKTCVSLYARVRYVKKATGINKFPVEIREKAKKLLLDGLASIKRIRELTGLSYHIIKNYREQLIRENNNTNNIQ